MFTFEIGIAYVAGWVGATGYGYDGVGLDPVVSEEKSTEK